ncbi:branched-chain amino acid ABC transporter permease [Xanthobacter sp. VNH20]|uniref:branched-chain amino acid ABC transporter permease n=1 Tax=Xanthobacter sp. VNH20 TaxID=3156616 RepID=UPI0032B355F4
MPNLAFFEPILIFTLLNVAMTIGLYVTALSGQLSMATAAIAGVGGYASGILTVKFGVPFLPAVAAGAFMGGALGCILALLTLKMRDFILKLTTLAAGEALSVLAFNWDYIGGANSFTGLEPHTGVFTCLVVALLAFYVAWRFDGSRLGYAARAVRDDPLAAASMGVSVAQVRIITFTLGSALIGMAGAVQAHYLLVITPSQLGFFVSLNYVIFLLFGGLQTLAGPILGAVVLTALPEALRFANEYRLIVYGLIIVGVMLWRPDGLLTRTPLGVARRILGFTLRPARLPKGALRAEDVLSPILPGDGVAMTKRN